MRNQLFGQKRERDAEDGLLRVITQLQTALALATGLSEGPLRAPGARAQALGAMQDGLNGLIAWHREQVANARTLGAWAGPAPELARDVLAGVQALRPLFEGAEASGGALDCRDLAQSVAQLRGTESDSFFNDALDGLLAMLEAVYMRISVDAPTATTAATLRDLWNVMVDELRAFRCDEMQPELELVEVAVSDRSAPVLNDVMTAAPTQRDEVMMPAFRAPVIELARFRRLELEMVAC
ncbi:MAG: hypothetical protein ACR2NO_10235 [Chloroflexota bacterium]